MHHIVLSEHKSNTLGCAQCPGSLPCIFLQRQLLPDVRFLLPHVASSWYSWTYFQWAEEKECLSRIIQLCCGYKEEKKIKFKDFFMDINCGNDTSTPCLQWPISWENLLRKGTRHTLCAITNIRIVNFKKAPKINLWKSWSESFVWWS